jgi:hypothetical protein
MFSPHHAVRRAVRSGWPLGAALIAAVGFRLPAILHAAETNSDAAIVGLQAMHILRGEWSWFLWGSGYQTSIDSAFAALVFGVLGPTPRALVLSSLGLHLVVISLAWSVLARRIDGVRAALAVFPLVVSSSPLQTYILYPPRQASLTIAVAALWAFDRAAEARRARAFATGAALLAVACFADPYALIFVPPIGAFGLACAIDRANVRASLARIGGLMLGALVGGTPFFLLRASARATDGQLALVLDRGTLLRHARLLLDACLPWTIAARGWSAEGALGYAPWNGPFAARVLLRVGGTLFLVAIAVGGGAVFARSLAWSTRRLAIAGGLALPVTIAGFLVSPMVMDLFSARYLAAIPLLAPFALAPLAEKLGLRRFALLVAPCAAASAIAGWVGYGPFLRAPSAPNEPSDEARLEAALEARRVPVAIADYWAAYRLTFLTGERLVVVPLNPAEDRYPPYRAPLETAATVVYVFDPARSREDGDWMEDRVRAGETPYLPEFERLDVGRFHALLLARATRPESRAPL